MNLAELLFGKLKMKGKISVEVDDEIEKAETQNKHGIPKELIKGAVAIGFDEDKEHIK